MKKSLLIPVTALILFSCTDSMQEYSAMDDLNNSVQMEPDRSHFVSKSDVAALLRAQSNSTRSVSECEDDITCFVDEKHDTLLYACNKTDGGWIVYASDTRVPAIIAESSAGTFAEAMENEAAHVWLQATAEEIKVIKSLSDDKLNFSAEEIEGNKKFWKSISSPDEYMKEKNAKEGPNETRGLPMATGHYELVNTISHWENYDSIPRLTTTDWDQHAPFNNYCPYKSGSSTEHAPAGCVAIAGAQMLYFLHNKLGVPETAPSEAYVFGHVGYPDYYWSQYNYTSTIWNDMATNESSAAPLIADVGRRVNMNYGNNGSGAYTSDLVNGVFAPYGISCTYATYNTTNLRSSLSAGFPVIVSAYAIDGQETVGHAFIIDRYKRARLFTENVYWWVWDTTPPGVPLLPPDQLEITDTISISNPEIRMIGMNWGWGEIPNNNGWYSLTGDWIDINSLNWNISRNMIYNFQVASH